MGDEKSSRPLLYVVASTTRTEEGTTVKVMVQPLEENDTPCSIILTRADEVAIYRALSSTSGKKTLFAVFAMYRYLRRTLRNQGDNRREHYRNLLNDLSRMYPSDMARIAQWCATLLS